MREIVFDTESTGIEVAQGHRMVEIGCVELFNHVPTGKTYQTYINPQRDMPKDAEAVHGLTEEFLSDKPLFTEIIDDFLTFIGDAPLVAHNAEFDMKFLNAELALAGLPELPLSRAIDTLKIAREKFPGSPASLDALCRRFEVDASERNFHGALLDAELLAEVYLELMGGRQHGLGLGENEDDASEGSNTETQAGSNTPRNRRAPRPHHPSEEELAAHNALVEMLDGNLWREKA